MFARAGGGRSSVTDIRNEDAKVRPCGRGSVGLSVLRAEFPGGSPVRASKVIHRIAVIGLWISRILTCANRELWKVSPIQ